MLSWNRREFIKAGAFGLVATAGARLARPAQEKGRVSLVGMGTGGRDIAIRKAIELVGEPPAVKGVPVVMKPNFNSADAFPGSTHNDTLASLVRLCRELGAERVTVADRSGMGNSREVMEEKGVLAMARELDFEPLPLEDLPEEDWVLNEPAGSHWSRGFYVARVFHEAESVIQTCCLKTHRFGGHFTLSLKNVVGMVAKQVPGVDHDFMRELHGSRFQRQMIAEANLAYRPALIVMDAVDGFVDEGPDKGKLAHPGLVLASKDRVALDAVGVAILRDEGTNETVSMGRIFEQDQIRRAVELRLGVATPDDIEIVTADGEVERTAERLRSLLNAD